MSTLLHRLARWAETAPHDIAQRYKEGGIWKPITAREYCDRVYWLALFLQSEDFGPESVGCIYSANSPQWVHLDLAAVLLGGKSAGVYPNSNPSEVQYILEHTEATVLSVQNREFFERLQIPARVRRIVVFEGEASFSSKAISYVDALEAGRKLAAHARPLEEFLARLNPHDGSFMIYTSGTTGKPKGALLSNDNFCFTADRVAQFWPLPPTGRLFSFLPLCHVAEKLQCVGVGISKRYAVSFATRFETVATELPEAEPSLLLSVPRLWEKMMEGVLTKVKNGKGAKKVLAQWALGVGERLALAKFSGGFPSPLDALQYPVADKLVLSKVRAALGLGKAETCASGAAALPAHVARWFRSIGIEILEDFGQTESTGVICMTEAGKDCAGTVGKPVTGLEVKLAEDGEILTRGRHVFKGYYKDAEATSCAFDGDWLKTGDIAEFNPQGYVVIRGRKKEVMKTSGGKMIAPLPIEEALKVSPVISQVCLVGDGRKFLTALVTLTESTLAGLKVEGALVKDPGVLHEVQLQMDQVNKGLAGFERIKKFAVLAREFSIVDGEMTPTLKMKRSAVEKKYKDIIDGFYAEAAV